MLRKFLRKIFGQVSKEPSITTPTEKVITMSKFRLSKRSLERLKGVHPDLVKVVKRALELSEIDFLVLEGIRTLDRQKSLVASGASRTLRSRHITGHAVDLAPIDNKTVSWHWAHYYKLADAMKRAAIELNVPIRWGGVWDKELNSLELIEPAVAAYVASQRSKGKSAFIDGPHFELPSSKYPV